MSPCKIIAPSQPVDKAVLAAGYQTGIAGLLLLLVCTLGCSRSPATVQNQIPQSTTEDSVANSPAEQPFPATTNLVADQPAGGEPGNTDSPVLPSIATPITTASTASAVTTRKTGVSNTPNSIAQQDKAETENASQSTQTSAAQPTASLPSQKSQQKKPEAKQNSKTFDLTFDDLAFDMEKGGDFKRSMLTPEINEYNGSKVRLRGYIRPSTKQKGLTKFVFVRDNKECCFGPGAALYDCVLVRLTKDTDADFTVRPVTIEGKFYIKEYMGPDDKIWAVFRMKDGKVK